MSAFLAVFGGGGGGRDSTRCMMGHLKTTNQERLQLKMTDHMISDGGLR